MEKSSRVTIRSATNSRAPLGPARRGVSLRRRQLLDLLGDLPQRVGGDRLHLLGQLLAIAGHERDLLLGGRAQLGELPLVRRIDRAPQPRDDHDRQYCGAAEHPGEERHEV